jgi:hypothetical protein
MTIYIRDGVIIEIVQERVLDAPEADKIARANGFQYAEQFITWRTKGAVLSLNNNLQIEGVPL